MGVMRKSDSPSPAGRIAELEQENSRLRLRERQLSDFIDNAVVGMHWVDRDGRILWANKSEFNLLGYTSEEYIGHYLAEFHADPYVIEDILQRLLAGETLRNYEARLRCKDGSLRHVLISSNVLWCDDEFVHTRSVTRDITDRKQADSELQKTGEMLQTIIHASPLPVVAITPEGAITVWNPAAERVFGWSAEEVLHKPLPFIPEKRMEEHRAMRALDLQGAGFDGREICRQRKDGSVLYLLVSTAPMHAPDGQISGIMSIYVDITERKEADDQLKQHAERLALSNAALEQYAYAASHDLQEPLRMVITYSQLLEKRYRSRLDTEADQLLSVLQNSASRMRQLISDLLAYSRTIAEVDRHFAPVHLSASITEALANCQVAVAEAHGSVLYSDLPEISGNREQLVQLFQNLLSNSLKYRKAQMDPQIEIAATRDSSHWTIAFRDNGVGFSMDYAERIFGVFKRLHGPEIPGTGIGLALCKRIVENHGGRIWAESQPGHGSTFYFTVPVTAAATEPRS